jgi:hypothetical protein
MTTGSRRFQKALWLLLLVQHLYRATLSWRREQLRFLRDRRGRKN